MVAMLDLDHSGKLGLEEFKTLLNDIVKWKVTITQLRRTTVGLRLDSFVQLLEP